MTASEGLVLVATDLGQSGDEALRQAAALSARYGSTLLVCHAIPATAFARPLFPQRAVVDAEAIRTFETTVAESLAEHVSRITGLERRNFRVAVLSGSPHGEILGEAGREGADLIVVGGAGSSRTTELVVRYAACPVLVARSSPASGPVLAATDLSEPSLPAVEVAAREAARRGSSLIVIHVVEALPMGVAPFGIPRPVPSPESVADWLESAREQLHIAIAGLGAPAEGIVREGYPASAILKAAREFRPQLLVVGTHGRTGLERMALGSVAEMVVRESPYSVLVVRLRSS